MKKHLIFSAAILIVGCFPKDEDESQTDHSVEDLGTDLVSSDSSLPFGTYSLSDPDGAQMEAQVGGKLQLADNCLYIGSDYIAVFPSEHTVWNPVVKELVILDQQLAIGDSIMTNGGFFERNIEIGARLVDPIPMSCVGNTFVIVGTEAWAR